MDEDFLTLLESALVDPDTADYAGLREAYARSGAYLPWGREQGGTEALHQLIDAGAWEKACELVARLLEDDPLSIPLRLAYAHVLEASDDEFEASTQRAFANGLLRAVLRSGDGRTPESALRVLDSREEYLALEVMGLRPVRSQLTQSPRGWLDVVEVTGRDGVRTIYFDVDLPQGWLASLGPDEED